MNIHECAESLYVSSWFPPVSSSYANYILTSPYGHTAPSFSLINDAEKMFFLPRKISSFKTESVQILMGSDNSGLFLTWWLEEIHIPHQMVTLPYVTLLKLKMLIVNLLPILPCRWWIFKGEIWLDRVSHISNTIATNLTQTHLLFCMH